MPPRFWGGSWSRIPKLKVGQVSYCCWCDDRGKLLDDGTVWRLDDNAYRVTAAEPNLAWFNRNGQGYDVAIEESTARIAAVSLQGPNSRDIRKQVCDADMDALRFFWLSCATFDGFDAVIRAGNRGSWTNAVQLGDSP